jgi:PilZ domain-containing protein
MFATRRKNEFVDRRKSERQSCRRGAKIQFGTGTLPRDCIITDISAGGVKVVAENVDVPPQFTIILSAGRPRQCRLAWRIGYEFGAEFVD